MREKLLKLNTKLLQKQLENTTGKIAKAKTNVEINTAIEKLVMSQMDSEFSSIWFFNEDESTLLRERPEETLREISIEEKKGVLYKCFMEKKAGIYNYLASEKDYVASIDNPDAIKMKSKIILPLLDDKKFIGIVTAYSSIKNIKNFTEDDLEVLKIMAPYIINAIYKMHPPIPKEIKYGAKERRVEPSKRAEFETIIKAKEIEVSREEVESIDKTLSFMANAVHDMRTPANGLFGFLDLLEDQIHDPRLKLYLKNAKESAEFINELTTSILDRISSKRERGKSKKEQVNSVKFFSDISEIFAANMYAKKIKFNIFIDPTLPKEISLESLKLKRTIMNLIGNAYKFTPNEKSIEFSVKYSTKKKEISIHVKDTGIGIDPKSQEQIFEAFKQANDETALNYGGTGLGLSICAAYVKELGGELNVESELDEGSRFFFDIPADVIEDIASFEPVKDKSIKVAILMDSKDSFIANNIARYLVGLGLNKSQVVAISSVSAYPENMTHLISFQNKSDDSIFTYTVARNIKSIIVEENFLSISKDEIHDSSEIISQYSYYGSDLYSFINSLEIPKVLIVDDDDISVLLIKTILESEFCEVVVARDGERALSLLIGSQKDEKPFSLVFLDNKMPAIYGSEVMKKFRTYEKDNSLKAIYAVSISGEILTNEEDSKCFDIYIGKPFKKEDIKKALENIID